MNGGEYYSEGYKAGQRDAYDLTYFHAESCLGRAAAELSPSEFEIVSIYLNDLLAILERRLSKMSGIRFYNVVWETGNGYTNTTEGALSFRNMKDILKRGEVEYFSDDGSAWNVVKVQEIETPMIEIEWLLELFTKSGTAKSREAHRDQAAYVLRLIERCAARVKLEDGTFIER